jgi:GPH family glycoside/pentoside/hexuronide:cation symporter
MAALTSPVAPAKVAKDLGLRRLPIKLFYGVGSVAFGVKDNGFQVLLLLFYNQALGLDARLAGLAIMIALIVDGFVDPTIGYLSDRLRSPWGRRHPFMYGAAVPVSLSYLLLFSPPGGLRQPILFAYLLVTAVLVRIFISFYEIPSSALVAELTSSYDERTSFISFRFFFGWVGGLSMTALAFSVFLHSDASNPGAHLNVVGYAHYGVAAAVIMFCSILLSAIGTHSAVKPLERAVSRTPAARSLLVEVRSTLGSRSAVTAGVASLLMYLATGLNFGLGTYFLIYAWQLSAAQISILSASSLISAALGLFLSPWVSRRFDKRGATIRVALILIVLVPAPLALSLTGLLSLLGPYTYPGLLIFNMATTTSLIIVPTLLASMIADVVEDNEVRNGRRDEGVIFSLSVFVQKCASGLGVFVSTIVLTLAKFPTHAKVGQVRPAIITHLSAIYISTVVALYLGSVICVFLYQITRERHMSNLAILASRREALPAAS